MKTLSIIAAVALCMIGCAKKDDVARPSPVQEKNRASGNASLGVSRDTSIEYENYAVGSTVVVEGSLADLIMAELNDRPDRAEKGVRASLDTRKYLHVGTKTFQVVGSALVLMDDSGIRTWVIKDIEMTLDALIPEAREKPGGGDGG